jgi:hypothetical protein
MNAIRKVVLALAASFAIAAPSFAQVPGAPTPEQRMSLLREQMDRIRAEEDPKVRAQLIDRHIRDMQRALPQVDDVRTRLEIMDMRMDVFEVLLDLVLERLDERAGGVRAYR